MPQKKNKKLLVKSTNKYVSFILPQARNNKDKIKNFEKIKQIAFKYLNKPLQTF